MEQRRDVSSAGNGSTLRTSGRRVRAVGWDAGEAVAFGATLVLLQLAILKALPVVYAAALPFRLGTPSGDVVTGLVAVVAVALYFGVVRLFEGRSAVELVASKRATRLGVVGLALGTLLFVLVMATLLLTGHAGLSGSANITGCVAVLFGSLFAAVNEELLFRGIMFRLIERHAGTVPALVVSAAAFGLVHAANPGATWLSSIAISLEAGVLLGAAYAGTRSLWFPIGLHFGWNFTESGIFGADVSGFDLAGLYRSELAGTRWMTGGAFGPEAGLPAIVICLAASLFLMRRGGRQSTRPPSVA